MSEYVVEAKSRFQLRTLANELRDRLGLHDCLYFPIVELLDLMEEIFEGFSYEIIEDSELPPGIHGDTNILKQHIRIKESVYLGAVRGNGRDRMTIAHEIAHYFTLCFCGFTFQRNFKGGEVPAYCSPEWQAKCFAAELLIPAHLTKNMNSFQIAEFCGVSSPAAEYQYKIMHRR